MADGAYVEPHAEALAAKMGSENGVEAVIERDMKLRDMKLDVKLKVATHWGASGVDSRAPAEVKSADLAATPWWLWWNVLSVDAPMVAVAWALAFAKAARVQVPGAEIAALGLVVWLIYTVDRLLDGRSSSAESGGGSFDTSAASTGAFGSPLRQRHMFHRVHARAIAWIAAIVATIAVPLLAYRVGESVLKFGAPLGLILVLYMAWVHLGRGRVMARIPKEVAVGGIFAAGVVLPAWSRLGERRWEFFLLATLFAAVCTLNCVAIEEWERVRRRDGERSAWGRRIVESDSGSDFGPGKFALVLAVCAAAMAPVVRLRGEFSAIGAAISVSAVLILSLDLMREKISTETLRVLVDVALLLPAIAVLVFLS